MIIKLFILDIGQCFILICCFSLQKFEWEMYRLVSLKWPSTGASSVTTLTRSLSSVSKREKFLEKRRNIQLKFERMGMKDDAPEFQQLLRNFYKKAHPDIIRSGIEVD